MHAWITYTRFKLICQAFSYKACFSELDNLPIQIRFTPGGKRKASSLDYSGIETNHSCNRKAIA
jgi:hypothetical protein